MIADKGRPAKVALFPLPSVEGRTPRKMRGRWGTESHSPPPLPESQIQASPPHLRRSE